MQIDAGTIAGRETQYIGHIQYMLAKGLFGYVNSDHGIIPAEEILYEIE